MRKKSIIKYTKTKNYSRSKSISKVPSSQCSRQNLIFLPSKLNSTKLKYIEKIQKIWRQYYKKNIENKIIKIQSVYRGYNIRKIFNDIIILNKKLECFFFIIKITMFRHGINYDYFANKRIDYYSNHKKTKQFLLLQRRIKYFLFMKKIKILEKSGLLDNVYIKTIEYRTKIKSKNTKDIFYSKPMIKYHRPLSKILMLQRNYRLHLKYKRKLPRNKINKMALNKCPLIIKQIKIKKINNEELYKNVKMRPINAGKNIFNKVYYKYTPLLLIQRKYKQRYNYLKENFKLHKYKKIKRKVANKHHYIYHATVINVTDKILIIQKNIKYFLYRQNSRINLIHKVKIPKCEINKAYGFKEYIKVFFYEEFTSRLIVIIRKFFLSLYLNELIKKIKLSTSGKMKKNNSSQINKNTEAKRNSVKNQTTNLHIANKDKVKQFKRKETFNLSPQKNKPIGSKQRHGNLINVNDENQLRDRKSSSNKKVSFKNDTKLIMKDSKAQGTKIGVHGDSENNINIKNSQSLKKNDFHKKSTFNNFSKKPSLTKNKK